jgi:hypothetical protein
MSHAITCYWYVSMRSVFGKCVREECVRRARDALGWGSAATGFYEGVKDFVGEDGVFII